MTREEFLDSVSQIITTNERAGAGLKASTLGNLIVRSLRTHWNEFGFPGLKIVLQELERRSQVRLGADDKGALAVWPIATAAPEPTPVLRSATPLTQSTNDFGRLKKGVWIAFVNALPQGRRFMHRTTGAIRMGLFEAPQPETEWAEIHRIADDRQRSWAREFLESNSLSGNLHLREALNDGPWFLTFRQRLRQINPQNLSQWNRHRSKSVKAYVDEWCVGKGIDPKLTAEDFESRDRHIGASQESRSVDTAREHVLAALSRMPTHELLQIPIAGKYFFPQEPQTAH